MTGLVRLPLFSIAAFAIAANSKVASAHPGHAFEIVSSDSPLHYLTQWEHLAVLIGCAGLLAIGVRLVATIVKSKRAKLQPLPVRKQEHPSSRSHDDRLQ